MRVDEEAAEQLGPDDDQRVEHSSLSNVASDWIARKILDGSIAPGQKITEIWLAEQMGISRSPVREALRFLSRDGLVVIEPRRGARVGELDRKHAEDLYACRIMVEPAAVRLAVEDLTPAQARQLETVFARMRRRQAGGDAASYVGALQEYNLKMLDACPNRILYSLAETTWRGSLRYWNLLVRGRSDYIEQSMARNAAVHAAALAGDAPEAERLSADLLETSRDELRTLLNHLPSAEREPTAGPVR